MAPGHEVTSLVLVGWLLTKNKPADITCGTIYNAEGSL